MFQMDGGGCRVIDDCAAVCTRENIIEMEEEEDTSREGIVRAYLTPGHPIAFSSPGAVYNYFGGRVKLADIVDALRTVESYSLHREYKQPRVYNPFYVYHRRRNFQADLIDVSKLKYANRRVSYLLVVIDSFTKKVWVMPLKSKSATATAEVLASWIESLRGEDEAEASEGAPQRFLYTDRGKEFVNRPVRELLAVHNFRGNQSQRGLNKAAIAERVNKTLQLRIYKYLTHTGRNNYIDELPNLVHGYNNAKHRTLRGLTPDQADKPEMEEKVRNIHGDRYTEIAAKMRRIRKLSRLSPGDLVLIRAGSGRKIGTETRAYTPNFERGIHAVVRVNNRMPVPMYKVHSLLSNRSAPGMFYAAELSPVNPRRMFKVKILRSRRNEDGGEEKLVHWEGLHRAYESWVRREDIKEGNRVSHSLLPLAMSVDALKEALE